MGECGKSREERGPDAQAEGVEEPSPVGAEEAAGASGEVDASGGASGVGGASVGAGAESVGAGVGAEACGVWEVAGVERAASARCFSNRS